MLYAGPKLENDAGTDAFALGGGVGSGSPGWQVTATGTGASQDIALPSAVTAAALAVYVNGLRSLPSEYSVTGTTLTLTAPTSAAILADKLGGVSGVSGTAIVTAPRGYEHEETIAAVGVTPGMLVFATLAAALDADENDPAMIDLNTLWARAGTDEITFSLTFTEITSGPINILWTTTS